MLPRWGIIEEHTFREEARALVPDARLLDDLLDGVKFVLALDPREGRLIAGSVWWIVAGPLPTGQTIAIYYTFDEEFVTLQAIQLRATDS